MKITAIIPARFNSTRFHGKVLKKIGEKTVIQHVYENTCQSKRISSVIVATDSQEVIDEVNNFQGNVVFTRSDHQSGTDRIAEVAETLATDLVVNVQGDEPFVDFEMIEKGIELFDKNPDLQFATLRTLITEKEDYENPNVVKMVCDKDGYALYFSRSPIPYIRDGEFKDSPVPVWKHVGMYFYKRDFLLKYVNLPASNLEKAEKLEQLRALENGVRILTAQIQKNTVGIDVPEDLVKAQKFYDAGGNNHDS